MMPRDLATRFARGGGTYVPGDCFILRDFAVLVIASFLAISPFHKNNKNCCIFAAVFSICFKLLIIQ